jgi:hypothetical protein
VRAGHPLRAIRAIVNDSKNSRCPPTPGSPVAAIEQIGKALAAMRRGVDDQPAADQPVVATGADVVLVADSGTSGPPSDLDSGR